MDLCELVLLGAVLVHALWEAFYFSGDDVDLEWVEGPCGGCGPVAPRVGDPLAGPEELGELLEGQVLARVLPGGSSLDQGFFDRCAGLSPRQWPV